MDNNDEIEDTEMIPDNEENQKADEYNPYENFLDDDSDSVPKSNNESNSKVQDFTDESDIQIPDFLKGGSDFYENTNTNNESKNYKNRNQKKDVVDEFNPENFKTENSNEQSKDFAENGFEKNQNDADSDSKESSIFQNNKNHIEEEKVEGGDTNDKEAEIKFETKQSADDADKKPTGKPKVLNKKFLLSSIIIVFGLTILITFLMPDKKNKNEKSEKPVAERRAGIDYSAFAKRQEIPQEDKSQAEKHYEEPKSAENTNNDVEIPPVIPDQADNGKKAYTSQNINYNSGKGGGYSSSIEIPDTRNDSLHGKTISGIKGLSSTQASYSTDYQQTVQKNTTQNSSRTQNFSMPSKEEYTNNILDAYSKAYGSNQTNDYATQNDQAGKNSFYNNGRNTQNTGQGEWLNLNSLWQGTIFEATLTSELNTDLPGEITARVAKNIYSSQDGRFLLIPQNSVLYGTYNSSISYSQSRVQVVWTTLVRPDGYQIQLGSMNGTDAKGASGLKGLVNDHPLAYLKAIGLMSVFSIVNSEFQNSMGNTNNEYVQNLLANSQSITAELGDKLIDRAMNVQPTIKIKAGTKINIVVNQNITIPPCEDIPVTQQYRKY